MSTKRKVYTFYIIAILVMVLVLMLFDLNIMAKAIVGLMIVFCIFVMRSIQTEIGRASCRERVFVHV